MSNSRLKYLDKDNAFQGILSVLFEVFDDKLYTIHGWGQKTIGYGIKKSQFNEERFQKKIPKITERTFKHHKNELIERRFIKVFDKTNRVKRGPYYSITPIGMFYMLVKLESFPKNLSKKILKFMEFYVKQFNSEFDNSFFNYFNEKNIKDAIDDFTEQVVFKKMSDGKNLIRFEIAFNDNVRIRFLEILL